MVSASWLRRKSSNLSACEPRAPRWTSEINKVRKRRSGLSSLTASLPMNAPLTDSHDKGMTGRGTAQRRPEAVLAQPCDANQTFTLAGDLAVRCDNQATRIGSVKPMEMMDRPMAMADTET